MTVFFSVALAVLTIAFVAYPFFKETAPAVDAAEDEKLKELQSRRDTAYSMLKELEFDFQSGILTEEDYRDLESRYKQKAISILKDIDNMEAGDDVEDEIEKQVRELRSGAGCFCSQCGTRCQKDARFCFRCGAKPGQGESID